MSPTAAISSRSAVAATRPRLARSPSPTVWPSSSTWSSGRRSISTGGVGPSSASSRTHSISVTSSLSSPLRQPGLPRTSRFWSTRANGSSTPSQTPCPRDGRSGLTALGSRGEIEAADSLAMFSVATVFLLLASLVAAAGFAVVAQRRLRQLGMLAAIGATQKHLRLVLLTNGAVVGVIAAILGTIAGGALWVIFAPTLESAMGHRIDRLSLPWTLLAIVVLLAILGATAAAWWPGRTVARLPTLTRAFGASASAEARTPLGDRRRGADHGRHWLSRTVRPRPSAAHHRRDRRDDPRHPAPRPTRNPRLLRSRRTRPDRHAPGAA